MGRILIIMSGTMDVLFINEIFLRLLMGQYTFFVLQDMMSIPKEFMFCFKYVNLSMRGQATSMLFAIRVLPRDRSIFKEVLVRQQVNDETSSGSYVNEVAGRGRRRTSRQDIRRAQASCQPILGLTTSSRNRYTRCRSTGRRATPSVTMRKSARRACDGRMKGVRTATTLLCGDLTGNPWGRNNGEGRMSSGAHIRQGAW